MTNRYFGLFFLLLPPLPSSLPLLLPPVAAEDASSSAASLVNRASRSSIVSSITFWSSFERSPEMVDDENCEVGIAPIN
jgi:hypothetical protein